MHHNFFTENHGSPGYFYHKVYDHEEEIPDVPGLGKTQVADKCIMECLDNCYERMIMGAYQGRQLVFTQVIKVSVP
ncbi:hypothetical protein Bca4012_059114 [Brassica carinata]